MASEKKSTTTSKTAAPLKTISKKFVGEVVSSKNDKTIIVKIEAVKKHPKYQKRYVVSRRYKVHDEKNQYKVGDQVSFIECRPMSKDKRWRVIKQD